MKAFWKDYLELSKAGMVWLKKTLERLSGVSSYCNGIELVIL